MCIQTEKGLDSSDSCCEAISGFSKGWPLIFASFGWVTGVQAWLK
jgi:hypothetical protein